jgi:CheY-like chemotaxis protein
VACVKDCRVTRTILVADDEPDLVANCEQLLQREGHAVMRAHTGPEAMALIDRSVTLPGSAGSATRQQDQTT